MQRKASELFQEPTSGLTPKHYLKIFDSLNLRIYTSCMLTHTFLCTRLYTQPTTIFTKPNIHIINLHTTRQSTQCKLIANKTRTLASSQSILQMGPTIWNNVPTELYMRNSLLVTCARFSSRLKRATLEGYGDKSLTSS